jgi:DNA-binding transcriptional LysR family regulator
MANDGPSLERYRVFRAVPQTRNLTRAGEQLFLTQPAVSQAMKKLEADVGTTLIIRTSRGVQLTPEGQA